MIAPFMTLVFEDHYGRRTRKNVQMQEQALLVDYQAVITAFAAALDTVVDLALVRIDLTLPATGTFAEDDPSNIDVGGTFTGVLYNKQGQRASFKIPGIKPAYADSAGNIDVANADIEDALELFVQATPYDLYISDGETIDHWVAGTLDT